MGYLNTGLVYSGPDGSMRLPSRAAHSQMPWAGKFEEALNGALNSKRTMARLLDFYYSVSFVLVYRYKKDIQKIQNLRCKFPNSFFNVF